MAQIKISRIFHATIFLDGNVNSPIGRASEIALPKIESETSEHKGLGMFGVLELSSGLKVLTMSFKWTGWYADLAVLGANPMKSMAIQVRANYETHGAAGKESELPLVVTARGAFKSSSPGTLKPMASADGYDDTMTLSYVKTELDGVELYEIDVLANIWRVDGVDLLEQMRTNLGG